MSMEKVGRRPDTLRDGIRSGELVQPGDRIVVVTESEGERTMVVTDVDQSAIHGEGLAVPIDDIVALQKRRFSPLRTAGAVAAVPVGAFLGGFLIGLLGYLGSSLF